MRFGHLVRAGLAALLATSYTPQATLASTAPLSRREHVIADSYSRLDRLDLENIIAYGDASGRTYDITRERTPVSAAPDQHHLGTLLARYGKLTISHNHPVCIDAYASFLRENGRQDLADRLAQVDKALAARRLLYERPSGADIRFLAATQFEGYLARPDSAITQQIVVTQQDKPFRVIEYDIDPRIKEGLRSLAAVARDAYGRKDLQTLEAVFRRVRVGIELLGRAYEDVVARYDAAHARPWDAADCGKPEPDARDFRTTINRTTPFRITDRGYLPSAQPRPEQYRLAA